jgi:hypothetical protein
MDEALGRSTLREPPRLFLAAAPDAAVDVHKSDVAVWTHASELSLDLFRAVVRVYECR